MGFEDRTRDRVNEAIKGALRAKAAQESKPSGLEQPLQEQREPLTRDDTLGRILRAMQPGVRRYVQKFSLIGLVTLPIRYLTLIHVAGGWLNAAPWAAAHDPWWFLEWLRGVAILAFVWFIFAEHFRMVLAERAKKRALKGR